MLRQFIERLGRRRLQREDRLKWARHDIKREGLEEASGIVIEEFVKVLQGEELATIEAIDPGKILTDLLGTITIRLEKEINTEPEGLGGE
jgi:hypothetical protein